MNPRKDWRISWPSCFALFFLSSIEGVLMRDIELSGLETLIVWLSLATLNGAVVWKVIGPAVQETDR